MKLKNILQIVLLLFLVNDIYGACTKPTGYSVSSITQSGATVSWNSVGEGFEYALRYRQITPFKGAWIYKSNIATTNYVVTGLSAGVTYQTQIVTECVPDNSSNSGYSNSSFFTTNSSFTCESPTNLTSSSITPTGVSVSWSPVSGTGVEYSLRYRQLSSPVGAWKYINNIVSTSQTVSGLLPGYNYQIQLTTECSVSNQTNSGYGNDLFVTTKLNYACEVPLGFQQTNKTKNTISLAWSPISGTSVEYSLRYRQYSPSIGTWTYINNITVTNYTLSGLASGTNYQIQLTTECSIDNQKNAGFSPTVFINTLPSYNCVTPANFGLNSVSSSLANLAWSSIEGTGVEYAVRYRTYNPIVGAWSYINDITDTTYTLSGLIAGTNYQVQMTTECSIDNSSNSGYNSQSEFFYTAANYPCAFPTNLTDVAITDSSISVVWDTTLGAEYELRYKSAEALTWTSYKNLTNASYSVNGLQSGMLYLFQVKTECSLDNVQTSDFSPVDSIITNYNVDCDSYLPLSYSVDSVSFTSAYVFWEDDNLFGDYEIKTKKVGDIWSYKTGVTASFDTLKSLSLNSNYFTSIRLNCSNDYVELFSTWSDSIPFTTNSCNVPTGLTDVVFSSTTAQISWNAIPNVDGYNVKVFPKSAVVAPTFYVTNNEVDLTDLYPGTVYRYTVQSVCVLSENGNSAFTTSTPGNRDDFTTPGVSPCKTPTGFVVETIGDTYVDLKWDSKPSVLYLVSYRTSYSDIWYNATTDTDSTHTYTGLATNAIYRFRVLAVCDGGELSSDWTNFIQVTTKGSVSCAIPTGLDTSSVTTSAANISWNSNVTADQYRLRYRNVTTSSPWTMILTSDSNYDLVGLNQNTNYQVQVSSVCSGALPYSVYSNSKFFKTASSLREAEIQAFNELSVYPNPTSGYLYVNSNQPVVQVQFISLDGRIISVIKNHSSSEKIDISHLDRGFYLVKVTTTNNKSKNFKITKE